MKAIRLAAVVHLLFSFFVLTACSSALEKSQTAALAKAQMPMPVQDYRIQPGDLLDLKFFFNPELNEQVIVRPDGRISLQLIKDIQVSGLTPAQLTDQLTKAYGSELKKPEVAVIVRSFNSHRVIVDGEVNRPGLVILAGPTTVLQSISQAGGTKETAKVSQVIVIRKSADAKPVTMVVDLEDAIDGTDLKQDIELMPFDIVYVPKSGIANVNSWVDLYLRRNVPIPIGFGYGL